MGQAAPTSQADFLRHANIVTIPERHGNLRDIPIEQPTLESDNILKLKEKLLRLESKINRLETSVHGVVHIGRLHNYNLTSAIDAVVEPDDGGFIARSIDLPLYAYSDDSIEAIESLKYEIETLYNDLKEDDCFTSEWLRIKEYLVNRIEE